MSNEEQAVNPVVPAQPVATETQPAPKKRGRPAGAKNTDATPKKRGRHAGAKVSGKAGRKGKKPATNTAPGILATAADIMVARGKQYDKPQGERSMGQAVQAFNAITGRDLRESEGWLLLQVLKDVRDCQRTAGHEDSLIDGVAYSALKAEARLAGK